MIDRPAQQDDVVGRLAGIALGERPRHNDRVVGADAAQSLFRFGSERSVHVQRDHGAGESRHDRRRVACAAADVENHVAGSYVCLLHQPCEHHGLHQVAAGGDLHVFVHIADPAFGMRNEALPGDFLHRADQPLVGDAVGPDLAGDHVSARGGVVDHVVEYLSEAEVAESV